MSGELTMSSIDTIASYEYTITKIGCLGDLGIHATGAIEPSDNTIETNTLLDAYAQCLSPVEDQTVLSCIDGRRSLRNADGSAYEVRFHQAGGDFAVAITALLGGSAVLPSSLDSSAVTSVYNAGRLTHRLCGLDRSSHLGGCGAANSATRHLEAIAQPAVQNVTKELIRLNSDFFNISIDDIDTPLHRIAERALALSVGLQKDKWDGNEYTNRALLKNAQGVEVLETADDATRGHHEYQIINN